LFSKYNKQQAESDRKEGSSPLYILAKISQFLLAIGLGMILFGFLFARTFLRIVYTDKWATDVSIGFLHHLTNCNSQRARS
jgi:hypothetical protein